MGCLGLGEDVVFLEPLWLQQGVLVGVEEEFCGAINVQIKHELY